MKENKSKLGTILIVLATIVLAGVAIFTAIRLYNLRDQAVAPNAPTSQPAAQETSNCSLSFTIAAPTATPNPVCNSVCNTDSQCPSGLECYIPAGQTSGNCRNSQCLTESDCTCAVATATPSPTPTPVPQCNDSCTSNSNCSSGLICYIASGQSTGNCRNSQCLTESDCTCAVATATPKPTATSTAVAQSPTSPPQLPESGTSWPTIVGTALGILIIVGSVVLAL